MSWEIAKAALDQTVAAVLRQGKREVEVAFQGDGEQFLAWPMMVRCTDYIHALAQSHGLRLRIWAITNGYLTSEMVGWALAHLDSLAISLDGPPDMHDAQRPLPNGQVSSSRIVEVIRQIDSAGGNYSLRATVAQHGVARMREIVEYVITHFPRAKSLVLDPLFPSYVSSQSALAAPTADEFVSGYLEAQRLADTAGLDLGYTGLFTLHELTGYHCDAWGIKLAVTPDGFVTSCPIIATREDPRAEFCIYGHYEDGNFRFNWTKLRKIMARNLNNLPFCSRCIARWHCAGECYSRLMMVADQSEPWRSFRCDINRRLIVHELERSLTRANRSPAH
jgi:uncharacterized protein